VVHSWATGQSPVPAPHCPTVEEFTGIACEQLQPAVRWYVLRGSAQAMRTTPAVEVLAADPGAAANDEPGTRRA
jgi:DNA-binding transcriptional regulator YdaS (Cro superfamily)